MLLALASLVLAEGPLGLRLLLFPRPVPSESQGRQVSTDCSPYSSAMLKPLYWPHLPSSRASFFSRAAARAETAALRQWPFTNWALRAAAPSFLSWAAIRSCPGPPPRQPRPPLHPPRAVCSVPRTPHQWGRGCWLGLCGFLGESHRSPEAPAPSHLGFRLHLFSQAGWNRCKLFLFSVSFF